MTNLIPPHARVKVVREYWLRVFSVWAILVSCAIVAVGALLFPTYESLRSQVHTLKLSESTLIEKHENSADAEAEIRRTNALATQLSKDTDLKSIGSVISAVNDSLPDGVALRGYSVARRGLLIESIEVQGVSASRAALAEFKTRIEANALFETANVPISDLVKDSNLPFAITITMDKSFNK